MEIDINKAAAGLIDAGEYASVFSDFEHKTYHSGSEAIILEFSTDAGTVKTKLWPYGTEKGAKFAQQRIAQMAKAMGATGTLVGEYDQILAKLKGKKVGVVVSEEEDTGYGPSNDVKYFKAMDKLAGVTAPKPSPKPVAAATEAKFEDDMPF